MARKVTVQDLLDQGVGQAQAERIVEKLTKPTPRAIWWQVRLTEVDAATATKAAQAAGVKNFQFIKRFRAVEKEEAPKK